MRFGLALLALAVVRPVLAGDAVIVLSSVSEAATYAVLVTAPKSGCAVSRVEVRKNAKVWKSPSLGPGDIAVIRLGQGFVAGDHLLTIRTRGCRRGAASARPLRVAKWSPDHAWRSAMLP